MATKKKSVKTTKKIAEPVIQHFCVECRHNVPDMRFLTPEMKPILCSCKFQKYEKMLRQDCCEHFERR